MSEKSKFFETTYENDLRLMAGLDFKDRVERLGAVLSRQTLRISSYGSTYQVSDKGIFDAGQK